VCAFVRVLKKNLVSSLVLQYNMYFISLNNLLSSLNMCVACIDVVSVCDFGNFHTV